MTLVPFCRNIFQDIRPDFRAKPYNLSARFRAKFEDSDFEGFNAEYFFLKF